MGVKRWMCGLGAATVVVTASCLEATEIDVRITTNVPLASFTGGLQPASVRIGTVAGVVTNPSSSLVTGMPTFSSDGGSLGDIVIVPTQSANDTVAIQVALGVTQTTASCIDPSPTQTKAGCIIATRTLEYIPHRSLVLPISLDSACLGVVCPDGSTCIDGACEGTTPDCDGGTCNPGDGASADVVSNDAISGCPLPSEQCGAVCVDVTSDKTNCGACGFDCSGGACVNSRCVLEPTIAGSCLALQGTTVYVITTAGGLDTVPTGGGTATPYSGYKYTAADLQSDGIDVAVSGSLTGWNVSIIGGGFKAYPTTPQANHVTVDNKGFGYFDSATGKLWYWPFLGTQPSLEWYAYGKQQVTASLAAASGALYAAIDGSVLCRTVGYGPSNQTCLSASSVPAAKTPTAVAVSDPTSMTPSVYVVENSSTEIAELRWDLGTTTTFASGLLGIGGIAVDRASGVTTSIVYGVASSYIAKAQSGLAFQKIAGPKSAVTSCVAVDTDAVYWLESTGGLYKAPK